jgi:WD40 repeat protein
VIVTASHDKTARVWDKQGKEIAVLTGHTATLRSCAISSDSQFIFTATGATLCRWKRQGDRWRCQLELRPDTQTRVWLDGRSQTLQIDGPDWPRWQLRNTQDSSQAYLGETIATLGPLAHEKLANAEDWDFVPLDDE